LLQTIPISDKKAWDNILETSAQSDFYHLHSYHHLASTRGEGTPLMFVYRWQGEFVGLPLLIRPLPIPEVASELGGLADATSVYGYPGPLCSTPEPTEELVAGFHKALTGELRDRKIVTAFTRLNPLMAQERILSGLGDIVELGEAVSIDLELPEMNQASQYGSNHRRDIRRAISAGFSCGDESNPSALKEFGRVYRENMERVGANPAYMFDDHYFERLFASDPGVFFLFVCRDPTGQLAAGGVFARTGGILQYHLGGTAGDALQYSPLKLVLDTARRWGSDNGARIFHLGGGVGYRNDSLLRFKSGFSPTRKKLKVWRFVVCPEIYKQLCAATSEANDDEFFPRYRAPKINLEKR
jgi:Acetyltransferase (GNAT) domain